MKRKNIGPANTLYPSLTTIVGADVDGKPNFLTIAHVGIMNHAGGDIPGFLSIGLNRAHYTNKGIHEHKQFSINIPSRDLLKQTDYVGIVSGKKTDKSGIFTVERGTLDHAPLIGECPVSMELRLFQTIPIGVHEIFIGEIVNTYADQACLNGNKPDLEKIDPILFDFMHIDYWSLGQRIGKPWQEGKELK